MENDSALAISIKELEELEERAKRAKRAKRTKRTKRTKCAVVLALYMVADVFFILLLDCSKF
ncbi:MAG: hypothetical protein C0469_04140 [Cyanobacteria bacterium DS2.3.42]|nr:hypothetical protein [Cyanobacteria bacterium DS2.3.42]